jgi:acetyl-CoA C-acetyltransferase
MARAAARAALDDAGVPALAGQIETLAFVRTNEDSRPNPVHPNGRNANLPGTLSREIGAQPRKAIYSMSGGQTPQKLVNEIAADIHAGETECAMIVGSEANGASKTSRRAGLEIDWSDDADLDFEDRGFGPMLLTRNEIKHGMVAPPYFYALFETAIAHREGHTRREHRKVMSQLFAPFSQVAAANPHAQFPVARSVEWLATPGTENREIVDPFLKWHIAQDAVNLGAAVILMSDEKADTLAIPPERRVYLHGAGEANDDHISLRPDLDRSFAMKAAFDRALEQAGRTQADMSALDIYSCFPCAVFSACDGLGLDWRHDPRALTLTGGLPFFGGPGNNYSLHAIAEMMERLRARPGQFGLILANGGWMTDKGGRGCLFDDAARALHPGRSTGNARCPDRDRRDAQRGESRNLYGHSRPRWSAASHRLLPHARRPAIHSEYRGGRDRAVARRGQPDRAPGESASC